MTPEERAEKIYYRILDVHGVSLDDAYSMTVLPEIAVEIHAAVLGARADMREGQVYDEGVAWGKAEAYADAAKIAEDHYWDSLEYEGVGKKHGASLAKAIRARAVEVGK